MMFPRRKASGRITIGKRFSLLLVVLPLVWITERPLAFAQNVLPANDGTGTLVTSQGGRIDIHGGALSGDATNLFHSFERFGLNANQVANFLSSPQIQNILGRVVGGNPSIINGLIQVTGGDSNLFLMNPTGILFGPNAQLNVPADFLATTSTGIGFEAEQWFKAVGANDYRSLDGNPTQFAFDVENPGSLINAGHLAVTEGKDLTLLGGSVINTGTLEAPGGNITVVAVPGTNRVRITWEGSALSIEFAPPKSSNGETLPIRPLDLAALLTEGAAGLETGLETDAEGSVRLAESGAAIPTEAGTAIASGRLDASGQTGGGIRILGNKVGLLDAHVDVSANYGGGQVLIGGAYQGKGAAPNASQTLVNRNTEIHADALKIGNGGEVIVWGDETTQFFGAITARGGAEKGDGGFVEVSSGNVLDFRGQVNTLAPNGHTGILLLDPTNIIVVADGGEASGLNDVDEFSDPDLPPDNEFDNNVTINSSFIDNALTNVILQANNNIFFSSPVNITTPNVDLTAQANNNILVNGGDNITTNGGDITLHADFDNNGVGSLFIGTGDSDTSAITTIITTNGGNFTGISSNIEGTGIAIDNSSIITGDGNIILTANEIDFGGIAEITGNNSLRIQPFEASIGISLGDAVDSGDDVSGSSPIFDDRLNLSNNDISSIGDNLEEVIIGRDNSTGIITVESNGITLNNNIILQSPGDGGEILVNGLIESNGSNMTLNAREGIDINADITTAGGDISLVSGDFIDTTGGVLDVSSLIGSGGAVNLLAGDNISTGPMTLGSESVLSGGALTANSPGAIDFTAGLTPNGADVLIGVGDESPPSDIQLPNVFDTAGGDVRLAVAGDFTVASALSTAGGDFVIDSPGAVTITAPAQTSGGVINVTGAAINATGVAFNASNAEGPGGNITLTANSGDISTGNLNSSALSIGAAGDVTLSATGGEITVASVQSLATGGPANEIGTGGDVSFAATGNITTGAIETRVELPRISGSAGDITLTSNDGNIDASGGILDSGSVGESGRIELSAAGAIVTSDILSSSTDETGTASSQTGGAIIIDSGDSITIAGLIRASSDASNGGEVSLRGNGDINTQVIQSDSDSLVGGTISITSDGAINTDSILARGAAVAGGQISVDALGDVSTGQIDASGASGGAMTLTSRTGSINVTEAEGLALNTSGTGGSGGAITLSASDNISTGSITLGSESVLSGGALTANSPGAIDFTAGLTPNGADVLIGVGDEPSPSNIQLPNVFDTAGGDVRLAVAGDFTVASALSTAGGDFVIDSPGAVTITAPVQTSGGVINVTGAAINATGVAFNASNAEGPGGNITLTANSGDISAGNLNSSALSSGAVETGGQISVDALGDVGTGQIDASGASGGAITLTSRTGSINVTGEAGFALDASGTNDGGEIRLDASDAINIVDGVSGLGNVNSSGASGGAVSLNATTTITAGEINTSGAGGNGGNVSIDPSGDVQVNSINAQGGPVGTGGNVNITTERFFRASGGNGATPSITTAGGIGGGNITIRHGGNGQTPLIIGDATVNGTTGAITSGDSTIAPVRQLFFTLIEGDIQIISIDAPPQAAVDTAVILEPPLQIPEPRDIPLPLPTIEERFTDEYREYLEITEEKKIKTLVEVRNELRKAEDEAIGVKPAVIYALFTSPNSTQSSGPAQEGRLELILVTSQGLPLRPEQLGPDRKTVIDTVEQFQTVVSDPNSSEMDYLSLSKILYRWLVTPIEKLLDTYDIEINQLIFVMDIRLRSLPIAALHDGEKFIIDKYSVGLMPTLSLTDLQYVGVSDLGVLIAGREFSGKAMLPNVPLEMESIRKIWPGKDLFNEGLSKESLRTTRISPQLGMVHLATHANFSKGDMSNSYIELWNDKLGLGQVRDLKLYDPPTELVVMSACQTAVGDPEAELGFIGFATKAGVKSAVGSLWKVDDKATTGFMINFYARLGKTAIKTKAEAVRQAQQSLLHGEMRQEGDYLKTYIGNVQLTGGLAQSANDSFQHPYFWSGLTILGTPW